MDVINPYPAELIYLNFQTLEVVSRYRDPQPQVIENYSYLFYLRPKHLQILMFKHQFVSQYEWFDRLVKKVKNDNSRDQQAKG